MTHYEHILIAVDVCDTYQPVIDRALAVADKSSRVTVAHIVEPVYYPENYVGSLGIDLQQKSVEFAQGELNALVEKHQLEGSYIDVGSPGRKVHDYARENGVDLIVVGSHGKSGVRLLLGSTATSVLHGASCDVLAVRIEEE